MPTKTYTRTVESIFTIEQIKDLLRNAHNHCKTQVKAVPHRIGKSRRRTVIMRRRDEYLNCIRQYIYEQIGNKLGLTPEQVASLVRS
jgi:hypothetical protein